VGGGGHDGNFRCGLIELGETVNFVLRRIGMVTAGFRRAQPL